MKYCQYCGAQLEDNAKFCHSCGNPTQGGTKDASFPKWGVLVGAGVLALLVVALCVILGIRLTDKQNSISASASTDTVPVNTPAPTESVPATPLPTEAPASTAAPAGDDGSWLVTAREPWKGAWVSDDEYGLIIFENSPYTTDLTESTEDGGYIIYRADSRDNTVYNVYEWAADGTVLTEMDADRNVLRTYRRPTYDEAPSPLPEEYWGAYTLVERDPNLYSNLYGPDDNFIIDAYRLGNCPYEQLTENSDATWTATCMVPPEGFMPVFDFVEEEGELYFTIYNPDGTVQYRYQRVSQ